MTEKPPKTSYEHAAQQMSGLRLVARIAGFFIPAVRERWLEVERQYTCVEEIRLNIELFADRYTPLGWVNYDRMSTDVLAQLKDIPVGEGEAILTKFHLDPATLMVLGYRFHMSQFDPWRQLWERGMERCHVQDWISAVPLLLIIIDGICTTSTGKHPFSGVADAEVFDSQTSEAGGLSDALRVLGATRRKLSGEPIDAPFRHGIVHGLNPQFGSAIVAAKTLNLLQAITDYFLKLRDEPQRVAQAHREQTPAAWKEIAARLWKNAATRAALEAWRPREARSEVVASTSDASWLAEGSPEKAGAEYLALLARSNYGDVAALTVDYPMRPVNARAGRLRQELRGLQLADWTITSVVDVSPSLTRMKVRFKVAVSKQTADLESELRMLYADDCFEAMVRGGTGRREVGGDAQLHNRLVGSSQSDEQRSRLRCDFGVSRFNDATIV